MYGYFNNFCFSMYAMSKGYYPSMFPCHFSHMSMFSFLVDSFVIYTLSDTMIKQLGSISTAKVMISSMLLGSLGLWGYHYLRGGRVAPY
mmetsp:Transcript_14228/g.24202  ORF Transcript_14228/g.24202 Transcript_14228/m.24202 type:complete len:89 (+) Transcript_14228:518-784(+)